MNRLGCIPNDRRGLEQASTLIIINEIEWADEVKMWVRSPNGPNGVGLPISLISAMQPQLVFP